MTKDANDPLVIELMDRLREWARRNKNSKYIPEPLLEAWGFEIESTL